MEEAGIFPTNFMKSPLSRYQNLRRTLKTKTETPVSPLTWMLKSLLKY